MRLRKRTSRLALGFTLAVASLTVGVSFGSAPERAPFVPQVPPQRALGDFDGDGRVDTALIQDGASNPQILVELSSGSVSAIHFEAPVTAVVQGDVDHDGDLDLVAVTSDGHVSVWINDGHGHFARQPRSRGQGFFTGEPVVIQATWPDSTAISLRGPVVPAPALGETTVVATQVCSPTPWMARDVRGSILPALRAPPVDLV